MSSATGARVSPLSFGVSASDASQGADREEIERGVAPLQELDRLERMAFERLHELGLERRAAPVVPKVPSGGAPARPAIWASFGRIEPAELIAVEFPVGREGDVVDVEIEPHADGVGGDEIVDVAGLVERDLGVAGARRERAEHDAAPPRCRRISSAIA